MDASALTVVKIGLRPIPLALVCAHCMAWSGRVRIAARSCTVPIVFVNISDPIGLGLIASLARPGGNLTGVLHYETGIVGKWLAMLKEIAPHVARAALVANPKSGSFDYFLKAG